MRLLYIFFLVFIPGLILGQKKMSSNIEVKHLPIQDTFYIKLKGPIFPSSVRVSKEKPTFFNQDTSALIQFEMVTQSSDLLTLNLIDERKIDSIFVSFRYLPSTFVGPFYDFDSTLVTERIGEYIGVDADDYEIQTSMFKKDALNYNGNFLRSLSLGNNQNLVFNSGLDLHMAGVLAGDISVEAAITDKSIPLQPEGNTSNIRELDKVFVRLSKKGHAVVLGDFQKKAPLGYFMKYNKKLQGVDYTYKGNILKKSTLTTSAFGSISRGKFNNFKIPIIEGNQGPYKLRGAQGENFIIIQSGTEKVYMDGQRLARGDNKDYTIDYNLGEITFQHNILITKDKRIFVEFEYTDLTYQKSLVGGHARIENKKWSSFINIYSEQDSKTKTESPLDSSDIAFLKSIGDNIDSVFVSSVKKKEDNQVDFSVTYRKIDTLINGLTYNDILVFSTDSTSTLYTASFTSVGPNNGDYILVNANVNGRVFEWVEPDNLGIKQGDYAPIQKIKTPTKHQMVNVGGHYKINDAISVFGEGSYTQKDPNTFSKLDENLHAGQAFKVGLDVHKKYKKKNKDLILSSKVRYEYTGKLFKPLQTYRKAEYKRDWNTSSIEPNTEKNVKATFGIEFAKSFNTHYTFSALNIKNLYNGYKHTVDAKWTYKKSNISGAISQLNTSSLRTKSSFFRPQIRLEQNFLKGNPLQIFAYYTEENNKIQDINSGLLASNAFRFQTYGVGGRYVLGKDFQINFLHNQRMDYKVDSLDFALLNKALEFQSDINWKRGKTINMTLGLKTRSLQFETDTTASKNTYAAFLTQKWSLFKGGALLHLGYELGTGQTPKLIYFYSEVEPGQGYYKWIDYNDDGIQQQTEFEIADTPDQANYLRFTQLSDAFIRTNNTKLSLNFRLKFSKLVKKKKFKNFKKLSYKTAIKINKKTLENNQFGFIPFILNPSDTSTVGLNASILNSIKYNGAGKAPKIEIGQKVFKNKVLKIAGALWRDKVTYFFVVRKNILKKVSLNSKVELDFDENDDVDLSRDFKIEGQRYALGLSFFKDTRWRMNVDYNLRNANGQHENSIEKLTYHDIKWTMNYAKSIQNSIVMAVSYTKVNYSGLPNDPLGFALLQTLRTGDNYKWQVGLQKLINKNLVLGIEYNGRKNGDSKVIHLGSMQINATF